MNICGHEYKVVIGNFFKDKRRDDDPMYFGHISYVPGVIHVFPKLSKALREEVLTHEVVHAIVFHLNCQKEHDEGLISAIASGLSQLGVGKLLWKLAFPKEKKHGVRRSTKTR